MSRMPYGMLFVLVMSVLGCAGTETADEHDPCRIERETLETELAAINDDGRMLHGIEAYISLVKAGAVAPLEDVDPDALAVMYPTLVKRHNERIEQHNERTRRYIQGHLDHHHPFPGLSGPYRPSPMGIPLIQGRKHVSPFDEQ